MEKHEIIFGRYLSEKDAVLYTSLKRSKLRNWCASVGAVKKIGKRIVYDREIIDKAMAAL